MINSAIWSRSFLCKCTITMAAIAATAPLSAGPTPAMAATTAQLALRSILQEGFALGISSSILFSQASTLLNIDQSSVVGKCKTDILNNYSKVTKDSFTQDGATHFSGTHAQTFYYDSACSKPYIVESISAGLTPESSGYLAKWTGTLVYYGPKKNKLGKLTISSSSWEISFAENAGVLKGAGVARFVPANGAASAKLALSCDASMIMAGDPTTGIPCVGGVSQKFSELDKYIGSIEPEKIQPSTSGDNPPQIIGTASKVITSSSDIGFTAGTTIPSLHFSPSAPAFASTKTTGTIADLTMFPAPPLNWTVTDTVHALRFKISVLSTAKNLGGSVVNTKTGSTLASFALDLSGTGTVTYADKTSATVTNWIVSR